MIEFLGITLYEVQMKFLLKIYFIILAYIFKKIYHFEIHNGLILIMFNVYIEKD